jgi:hypothetical protein
MSNAGGERVNLSTPRPEGWGFLEIHPEPRLSTPPLKAGLRAAERVKLSNPKSLDQFLFRLALNGCLDLNIGL